MQKKVIQRSLPLEVEYKLIETFYSSIEDGGGCTCENCGAAIANIAIVESKYGKFYVGMDCCKTLTGIKDSLDLMQHEYKFQQAKQARATIQKMIKKGANIVEVKTFDNTSNFYKEIGSGKWSTSTEPFNAHLNNWKQYPAETWQKYVLPMIQSLVATNR